MSPDAYNLFQSLLPLIVIVMGLSVGGRVLTTWMRIRHGYPMDNGWGGALYPKSADTDERVKLITQENAQLRAEMGSMKDRLATVERIVTDGSLRLDREIDLLRGPAN